MHRQLSTHLNRDSLQIPKLERNLDREVDFMRGEVHLSHVERWRSSGSRATEALNRARTDGYSAVMSGGRPSVYLASHGRSL